MMRGCGGVQRGAAVHLRGQGGEASGAASLALSCLEFLLCICGVVFYRSHAIKLCWDWFSRISTLGSIIEHPLQAVSPSNGCQCIIPIPAQVFVIPLYPLLVKERSEIDQCITVVL